MLGRVRVPALKDRTFFLRRFKIQTLEPGMGLKTTEVGLVKIRRR